MRIDPLRQYAKLREQLLSEKRTLEARLKEINQVLGSEEEAPAPSAAQTPAAAPARRGRRSRKGNAMSMREAVLQALSRGPLGRRELVDAVQEIGYVFKTKNPLNSIGAILYGKNTPVKNKDGKFYVGSGEASQATNNGGSGSAPSRRKRTMSPEARARISAAQKARWAKAKKS